jgi:hypothetical protein
MAKSDALPPDSASDDSTRADVPLLPTTTRSGSDVAPTVCVNDS